MMRQVHRLEVVSGDSPDWQRGWRVEQDGEDGDGSEIKSNHANMLQVQQESLIRACARNTSLTRKRAFQKVKEKSFGSAPISLFHHKVLW